MVENIYFGIMWSLFVTATNGASCSYYNHLTGDINYKYCPSSCCGTNYNRYCCTYVSNTWTVVAVVLGIIILVAIIVLVMVIKCFCCRKTIGHTGRVLRPAVPARGVQTTTVTAGYGQIAYTNAAFPQQLQSSNLSAEYAPKWQDPPPPYSSVNLN